MDSVPVSIIQFEDNNTFHFPSVNNILSQFHNILGIPMIPESVLIVCSCKM